MKAMRAHYRQSGFALLLVMMVVLSASILGMSYLSGSTVNLIGSDNLASANRAKYLAESGVYHAMEVLATDAGALSGSDADPLGPFYVDGSGDSYSFFAVPGSTGDRYVLTATGHVGGVTQRASVTVQFPCHAELVKAHNPLSYWRLGEASGGNARDEMGRYKGDYHDVRKGYAGAVSGDPDTSAEWYKGGSHVKCDDEDAFAFTSSFSVSAWVYLYRMDKKQAIAGNIDYDDNEGWLFYTAYSRLRLHIGRSTYSSYSSVVAPGRWLHVVVVYDDANNQVRFYRNGANVRTVGGVTRRPTGSGDELKLGNEPHNKEAYLDGRLDEVAIFDYALAGYQAGNLYRAGKAPVKVLTWDE